MTDHGERAALTSFALNVVLFILKISAALSSGSLAVLSSAFDSLNDIVSYFLGYYSIKLSAKGPDPHHPYGHRRLEPLAGLVMAAFAAILSLEIIRSAIKDFGAGGRGIELGAYVLAVLIVTIAVKVGMYLFLRSKAEKAMSTALDAMAMDSKNDILFNSIAIVGVVGASFGQLFLDDAAAIVIAFYIAYSGYRVAKKNLDYILGARPDEATMKLISKSAMVSGVKALGNITAHYVGDRVHAEIEIILPKDIKAVKSHDIGMRVQKAVESLDMVERAFVHIDYG